MFEICLSSISFSPYRLTRLSLRIFEKGQCSFRGLFDGEVPTFESNVPFSLRFMIDTKVRTLTRASKCMI